jgi:FkbM family methyltransferase
MDTLVIHPRLQSFLKNIVGYYPNIIVDIGAHIGMWSRYVKTVYPNSTYFLLEANSDCSEDLRQTGLPYEIALLGEVDGFEKDYFKINQGDTSGNSVYRERTQAYNDDNCSVHKLTTQTLDNILKRKNLQPDFIKLDVQGSELDVLKGATQTLKHAEFVLLEIEVAEFNQGRPTFAEIIKHMDQSGFEIFDLIELKYMPHSLCLCKAQDRRLNEMDILFCRKNSIYKRNVDEKVGFVCHE